MLLEGKKVVELFSRVRVIYMDDKDYHICLEISAAEDLFNLFVPVTQTQNYTSVNNVCSMKCLVLCIRKFSDNILV